MSEPTSPLKIAIFVSFANVGGAQIAALRLAHGLAGRGHDVSVRFLYEKLAVNSEDHPHEVVLKSARPGVIGHIKIAHRVYSALKAEKPDVVLTFLPLACVLAQACAWLAGIKTRVVSHRMPINTATPLMQKLDLLMAWAGIYTKVVCVSTATRDACKAYPKRLFDRAVVVFNGLLKFQRSTLTKEEARRKFGFSDNAFALVALGRFAHQKNYPLMLDAVARVEGAELAIAGDGPLRKEMEAQISRLGIGDKVRLLGNVKRGDIPDLLHSGDLFLQTSTYEGQSNTVLEALAAGMPMVLHDVPEQRETIEDPHTHVLAGDLVALNDTDGWVAAIERLRSDPQARALAAQQAERQTGYFTFERMILGFEKALQPSKNK